MTRQVECSLYVVPLRFVCQISNSRRSVGHIDLKSRGVIQNVSQNSGAVCPKDRVCED